MVLGNGDTIPYTVPKLVVSSAAEVPRVLGQVLPKRSPIDKQVRSFKKARSVSKTTQMASQYVSTTCTVEYTLAVQGNCLSSNVCSTSCVKHV